MPDLNDIPLQELARALYWCRYPETYSKPYHQLPPEVHRLWEAATERLRAWLRDYEAPTTISDEAVASTGEERKIFCTVEIAAAIIRWHAGVPGEERYPKSIGSATFRTAEEEASISGMTFLEGVQFTEACMVAADDALRYLKYTRYTWSRINEAGRKRFISHDIPEVKKPG